MTNIMQHMTKICVKICAKAYNILYRLEYVKICIYNICMLIHFVENLWDFDLVIDLAQINKNKNMLLH